MGNSTGQSRGWDSRHAHQHRHGPGHDEEDQLQAHKPKIIPHPDRPRPALPDAQTQGEPTAIRRASAQVTGIFGTHRSGYVSPFDGGDFIVEGSSGCTGGPIAVVNGTSNNRMLSAGHCGNVGNTVDGSDRSLGTGPVMGKVEAVRLCDMCIDSETVAPGSTGAHFSAFRLGCR